MSDSDPDPSQRPHSRNRQNELLLRLKLFREIFLTLVALAGLGAGFYVVNNVNNNSNETTVIFIQDPQADQEVGVDPTPPTVPAVLPATTSAAETQATDIEDPPESTVTPTTQREQTVQTEAPVVSLTSESPAPPTTAQTPVTAAEPRQGREYLNDVPILVDHDDDREGGEYSWYKPPPEIDALGYGTNGFWFTLAYANSDVTDNFARWNFEVSRGEYDVEVFVPSNWATANVQYLIWVDENGDNQFSAHENLFGPWLDQQQVSGWQSLGKYSLAGKVRIEVHDTRTVEDWRVDGAVWSRLAVDAIRLVEVVGP